jgi:hypothetical protein
MHKIQTGVLPPIYEFLFRSLSTLQVRHLHPELVCRHFVQNTQRRGFTASMTITPFRGFSLNFQIFKFWRKIGDIWVITYYILYWAYVRSKLEYGIQVWDPSYQRYVDKVETIQRRFLKFFSI